MKKNFFKKLSFVLALAMIVSTITPAAGAFAAVKAPKLSSTSKFLHLGDAVTGEYDFNISNKQAGWTYEWSSADTKVATVNAKNGVVKAVGIGSTEVSVTIYDKDGEVYDTLTADVTVRNNVKELSIYLQGENQPAVDKLLVGKAYDFGRKYTAESDLAKTSDITRWEVSSDKASITDAGVFTATEPGDYKLTARSFQSTAKYTAWKADKTLDVVTATATLDVKVVASIDTIVQKTATKFDITFTASMKDVVNAGNLKIADSNNVNLPIVKSVGFDATGKVATVETYISLSDKETYTVSYGDMIGKLVASQGAVAKVVLAGPGKVADNEAKALEVKYYDANDVEVSKAAIGAVDFAITSGNGFIDGDKIILFGIGDVVKVKATYRTGTYDANWNEIKLESNELTVVAVDSLAATIGGMSAWNIGDDASWNADEFKTVSHSLPLSATGKFIGIKGVGSDGNDLFTGFTFKSTDDSKLMVNPTTGELYPVQTGTVGVIVEAGSYKNVIEVTITPASEVASATPDTQSAKLSNSDKINATATFKLTVKDQYGNELQAKDEAVTSLVRPTGVTQTTAEALLTQGYDGKKATFTFLANGAPAGSYTYKLSANGKSVPVTVLVSAVDGAAVTYRFEVSSIDLKVTKDTVLSNSKVTIKLASYDKNGTAIEYVSYNTIKVKNSDGTEYTPVNTGLGTYEIQAVSGPAVSKLIKTGNYTVTGTVSGGTVIVPAYFTVSDTQPVPTVNQKEQLVTVGVGADLYSALDACFEVKSNNEATATFDVLPANVQVNTSVSGGAIGAKGTYSVLVRKVTVTETFANGNSVTTDVTVNKVITAKVE